MELLLLLSLRAKLYLLWPALGKQNIGGGNEMMPEKWSKHLEERLRINLVHLFYRTYNIISFIFILHLGSCVRPGNRMAKLTRTQQGAYRSLMVGVWEIQGKKGSSSKSKHLHGPHKCSLCEHVCTLRTCMHFACS